MNNILCVLESAPAAPWVRMLRDLCVASGAVTHECSDVASGLRLAQATLRGPDGAPNPVIFAGDELIVACDGRLLPLSSPSPAPARVADVYRRYGIECARHLSGEFAFVLWDKARRLLLAGCDPVGTRTLAYFSLGDTLLVSSRMLTLLRHPRVSRVMDDVYLAHTLCNWWAQPPGTTPFVGVHRIRPGFALIWQGGRTVERRVDGLRFQEPESNAPPREYYERFWALMEESVRDALSPPGPACVALSSGLDSTCVAVAAVARGEPVRAFSLVASASRGEDERALIETFVRSRPDVHWDAVDCGDDGSLEDPPQTGPILDEPCLLAAAFVPARLRLAREAHKQGFRSLVDGEGGDELFWLSPRFGDLVVARRWKAAAMVLQARGWKSTLWRQLLVPNLPNALQRAWIAREHRRLDPVPPWMTQAFRSSGAMIEALRQRGEWMTQWRSADVLPALLEVAPTVGSRHSMRRLDSAAGVETRSPFLDRRLVEFAGSIPADLRVDSRQPKVFLRRALEDRVPDALVRQPKNDRLYNWVQARGLLVGGGKCGLIADIPFLRARVNAKALEAALRNALHGIALGPVAAEQAWSVLATAQWMARVNASFGVPLDG